VLAVVEDGHSKAQLLELPTVLVHRVVCEGSSQSVQGVGFLVSAFLSVDLGVGACVQSDGHIFLENFFLGKRH
jgi:hypothetical protein